MCREIESMEFITLNLRFYLRFKSSIFWRALYWAAAPCSAHYGRSRKRRLIKKSVTIFFNFVSSVDYDKRFSHYIRVS